MGALIEPGDLLLCLGAGNIHESATELVADLLVLEDICALLHGEGSASLAEPLSKHTTLRVGGPAQFWVEPSTESAFARLMTFARERGLPTFVMGRGSNLLVRDGGIAGLVIHPAGGDFSNVDVNLPKMEITAGVGVGLKRLSGAAAKAGIGGFEWMEGIPGAVGGGLRMNAGAMGCETFDQVVRVRFLTPEGQVEEKTPADFDVQYRDVPSLKKSYALAATFRGSRSEASEIQRLLDASVTKRKTGQPIAASAGCIFKNPAPDLPAGKLVDELGLKNTRIGAARVSDVHGNFIVNDGGATAADVLALIAQIKETALRERGVELRTEVQIVGRD